MDEDEADGHTESHHRIALRMSQGMNAPTGVISIPSSAASGDAPRHLNSDGRPSSAIGDIPKATAMHNAARAIASYLGWSDGDAGAREPSEHDDTNLISSDFRLPEDPEPP